MIDFSLKIGLLPCRRDVTPRPGIFNWEIAEQRGRDAVRYIREHFTEENVSFVGIEGINDVGVMVNEADAEKIRARFEQEKVDAIFAINANFGNEEAMAQACNIGKPVCIYAPLDDRFDPDGMRYTDSQCGLFGVSRLLTRMNIPHSHINTCRMESETFKKGFETFLSAACMVKTFRNLKIAQVGARPRPFASVMYNESDLAEQFGIRVIPVNLAVITERFHKILETRGAELEEGKKLLLSRYEMDDLTPPLLEKIYAFVLLYEDLFRELGVQAISAECWTAMQLAVGAMPCTAYSVLADRGHIISCESDLHGAISMVLLAAAARGKKVPFFGEFTVRHPENPNAELLWHCGPFAYSLKAPDSVAKNVNMRQWFRVRDGQYTVAQFSQHHNEYRILNAQCRAVPGPYTFGTYLWAEFHDLDRLESKLLDGPYIHHCAEIEGDYTEAIAEFIKYIPNLQNDRYE